MFTAIVFSVVFIFLTVVVFVCVAGTILPLLLNSSNVNDLMPIALKSVKASIIMAAISGVLEAVSWNTPVSDPIMLTITGVSFGWLWVILYLLKYRERQLLS